MEKNMINLVDSKEIGKSDCSFYGVACVILDKDDKFVLQKRGDDWSRWPGYISLFGGEIEKEESPIDALIRALSEGLGAKVKEGDLIKLGAVTDDLTNHNELIHVYFWQDLYGTIKECREGEAVYCDSVDDALNCPKIIDNVSWALNECKDRDFL